MITKELFISTMKQLEAFDEKLNKIDQAFKKLNSDFCSFYFFEPFDITIELLSEYFNDKDGWLNYFVWEQGWLKDIELGDVTIDGVAVDLSDWGKVYDFLMENKNNGNTMEQWIYDVKQ